MNEEHDEGGGDDDEDADEGDDDEEGEDDEVGLKEVRLINNLLTAVQSLDNRLSMIIDAEQVVSEGEYQKMAMGGRS